MPISPLNQFRFQDQFDPAALGVSDLVEWAESALATLPGGPPTSQAYKFTFQSYAISAGSLPELQQLVASDRPDEPIVTVQININGTASNPSFVLQFHLGTVPPAVGLVLQGGLEQHAAQFEEAYRTLVGANVAALAKQSTRLAALDQRLAAAATAEGTIASLSRTAQERAASTAEALSSARSNVVELGKIREEAKAAQSAIESTKTAIDGLHKQVQDSRQAVSDAETAVKSVAANAAEATTTLQSIRSEWRELKATQDNQVQTAVSAFEAAKNQAMDGFTTSSTELLDAFREADRESSARRDELLRQVQQLLSFANAATLSTSFATSADTLRKNMKWWLGGVVATSIGIVALAVTLLVFPELLSLNGSTLDLFLAKLSLTLPLLVLDGFLIREYSRNRSLIQDYAFKAAVAQSLVASDEMFREQERSADSLAFMVSALAELYRPPSRKSSEPRPGLVEGVERVARALPTGGGTGTPPAAGA